ncbi:DDE-type integrase/transposase/recombinase [Maribrevibacterium harenarium]|uniref:DDE-type integrase/transposase/recombinase n=1 Tax=Maribrevibacterium harenarium TaxID=2589817 RepID=A0A501X072_9GAMM|nr:Mu transposase C-terminal domain-containing protein [Maribrevibacterium harenarium]TPE54265.1 DDE-type integrase/transposase/recombinase [Maribrevibacterium harenarium]
MYLNKVFLDPHSDHQTTIRVVYEHIDFLMLIDIHDEKAWPYRVNIDEFESLSLEAIPDPISLVPPDVGSKAEEIRNRAYRSVSLLLTDYFALFDKKLRNQKIKSVLKATEEPRLYVTRQLRRYWQRGMSPDALAPDYTKCGAPGQDRIGMQKPGSKRTISPGNGVPITEEVANFFRLAIEGFYLVKGNIDLEEARTKANGFLRSKYPTIKQEDLPSERQFRYFYNKYYAKPLVVKARTPSIQYAKDVAPSYSTSASNNFGPGARYEIDATIADLHLVSEHDPDRIVGRPIVYKVKDVFSRMTVGLYVGLENPSWATASIALAHAFCDKVEYCRKFGIEITESDWPSIGTPATITADRGELLGKHGDILVNRFGITLSNTRAYRGDDKGIVEKSFHMMHVDILPYVEGRVEPINGKKKAGKRTELSANLTLYDFTKMVIISEINRNTSSPLEGYDFESDMPTDLPAIPVRLWHWGVKNRTGVLREVDPKLTYVNMLPHSKATISPSGICFKGMYYTCAEAVELGWFHKNRSVPRPKSIEVAYDPLNTNALYVRPDKKFDSVWECTLQSRSRRYQDMCLVEAMSIRSESRSTYAKAKQEADYKAPDLQNELEMIAHIAQKRQSSSELSNNSKRLSGIRDNRNQERESERQKMREASKPTKEKDTATVTCINSGKQVDQGFDYPDLDDF